MNNCALIRIITCFSLFFVCMVFDASAQQRFTTQGEIEFEKRVNMHAFFREALNRDEDSKTWIQRAFDQYKTNQPQFKAFKSTLKFSGSTTLFTPAKAEAENNSGFYFNFPGVEQINTIQADLASRTSITQKTVFEETFLIKDTLRKITWKITDETREIAGYPCRRANALIMDSIYVVAFYTDKIPVSGGPESFTGLPGMILGVALPHDHITWFATKVVDVPVAKNTLQINSKEKITTQAEFRTTLDRVFKRWGDYAKPYLRFLLM